MKPTSRIQRKTANRRRSCSSWVSCVQKPQCFDRRYNSVMKSSTGSPFSGLRLLGHALLKIISLDVVKHSFPFLSGGKELGKRPFCFFVVYSSRLCRGSYLSDGILPTLWDGLPPCTSSALNRIGRVGEQPPRRRVHDKFKQRACARIIMMTSFFLYSYRSSK